MVIHPYYHVIGMRRMVYVYLYKNGVAEPQEITIGIRTESRVQVLQGLNVGDTLITSGVMQLRTGMKVPIDNLTE